MEDVYIMQFLMKSYGRCIYRNSAIQKLSIIIIIIIIIIIMQFLKNPSGRCIYHATSDEILVEDIYNHAVSDEILVEDVDKLMQFLMKS